MHESSDSTSPVRQSSAAFGTTPPLSEMSERFISRRLRTGVPLSVHSMDVRKGPLHAFGDHYCELMEWLDHDLCWPHCTPAPRSGQPQAKNGA